MNVALDATALIYAIEPNACRESQQADAAQVSAFIDWLKVAQGAEIQVPAPAHSEFLAFYAEDVRLRMIALLKRGFVVTPFDEEASVRAANLWSQIGGKAFRKRMKKDFDISKQCVKTDIQIVSTAIVHGAGGIITVDTGLIETAKNAGLAVMEPKDCVIPDSQSTQSGPSLFEK